MNKKTFKAGEIIFKEGSEADSMFRIEQGEVKVVVKYGMENEVEVATLKDGKYFGEMGVIDNAKRSATIIAKNNVELLVIDKTSFSDFVATNPEDAIKIMKTLTKSLRETTEDYVEACKTISELMEDDSNKPKKEGLWAKLKKYADVYAEACVAANSVNNYSPYAYGSNYIYF